MGAVIFSQTGQDRFHSGEMASTPHPSIQSIKPDWTLIVNNGEKSAGEEATSIRSAISLWIR